MEFHDSLVKPKLTIPSAQSPSRPNITVLNGRILPGPLLPILPEESDTVGIPLYTSPSPTPTSRPSKSSPQLTSSLPLKDQELDKTFISDLLDRDTDLGSLHLIREKFQLYPKATHGPLAQLLTQLYLSLKKRQPRPLYSSYTSIKTLYPQEFKVIMDSSLLGMISLVMNRPDDPNEVVKNETLLQDRFSLGLGLTFKDHIPLLYGYGKHGFSAQLNLLVEKLKRMEMIQSPHHFVRIMAAYALDGKINQVQYWFEESQKGPYKSHDPYYTLIYAHAKIGNMKIAQRLYEELRLQGIFPPLLVFHSLLRKWSSTF